MTLHHHERWLRWKRSAIILKLFNASAEAIYATGGRVRGPPSRSRRRRLRRGGCGCGRRWGVVGGACPRSLEVGPPSPRPARPTRSCWDGATGEGRGGGGALLDGGLGAPRPLAPAAAPARPGTLPRWRGAPPAACRRRTRPWAGPGASGWSGTGRPAGDPWVGAGPGPAVRSQACQEAAAGRRRWQPVELDVRWRACREPKEQNNYVTI